MSRLPVHNLLKSKKTQILLFLFSLPSHPSAVSYGPRAIVWHPDARQTAQTSSRWLFTTLQCPTTASSHRALPWPTAPQNRPTQAAPGAPDPAVTIQKARGPAGWAGGTRRPGRERQKHAQGQQSGPAARTAPQTMPCTYMRLLSESKSIKFSLYRLQRRPRHPTAA